MKNLDVHLYMEEMFKAHLAAAFKAKEALMTSLVAIDMIAKVSLGAERTIYKGACEMFGDLPTMIDYFLEKGEHE